MRHAIDILLFFARTFMSQALGYFVVTGLVFLVVWKLGRHAFRNARIQKIERAGAKQYAYEIRNTLMTLLIGTLNAAPIVLLYNAHLTRLSTDRSQWSWPSLIGSFLALVVFNDAWFFWWHRLLHRPAWFRFAHAVHHKSVDVNPFSSYSFHAFEAFILGAWSIPVFMFVPTYLPVIATLQVFGLAKNLEAHLGYEFMPRWFIRIPPFRWMTTSTYHNLHHTRLNGNYALYFRWWDRLLKTEVPEYERTFLQRGGANE